MTKLLASTALIAMLAAPAVAQTATDTTTPPPATTEAPAGMDAPAAGDMPATSGDTTAETPAEGSTAMEPADGAGTGAATPADPAAGDATASGFGYTGMAGDMSAETFIGKRLYVSEADVDANAEVTEVDQDWDDVGEISDLVIGADGQVKAVLVDIGGFLGMGEKSVAVAMDQLDVIRDGDSEGDYFIVFTSDRAALESAPAFEWVEGQP
ncbi:PRC-barrel domain-containing protein [Paracoccus laeviglucosivorans]|uniref:PRC-barrel domain-containing protein n=1 Tax=Paracoccus laeviglucosivorans TaxID=1197861 RepID=A0A521EZW4_9RHOB|nr:PRC-barrel domain-containing protein [Paracoccus laeviglucosivorans]SMO89488.1 PRC-barrel domain-containing protein [Paracoccus laeviglucosivorans]